MHQAVFEDNSRYRFFPATVWCSEPLELQLKHIQKPAKNCSFRAQFLKNEYGDPNFFLISEMVIKQRADTEKSANF